MPILPLPEFSSPARLMPITITLPVRPDSDVVVAGVAEAEVVGRPVLRTVLRCRCRRRDVGVAGIAAPTVCDYARCYRPHVVLARRVKLTSMGPWLPKAVFPSADVAGAEICHCPSDLPAADVVIADVAAAEVGATFVSVADVAAAGVAAAEVGVAWLPMPRLGRALERLLQAGRQRGNCARRRGWRPAGH